MVVPWLLLLSVLSNPTPAATTSATTTAATPTASPTIGPAPTAAGHDGYDLAIVMTVDRPLVRVGATVTWRVRIDNLGNRTATGLQLRGDRSPTRLDPTPPGWTCESLAHPQSFTCSPPAGTELRPGDSLSYVVTLQRVERTQVYLAQLITAVDPESDLNPHNNQADASVAVEPAPTASGGGTPGASLPVTGDAITSLVVGGAGLLGVGICLVLLAVRRRHPAHR
jgi:hypothetical protein